jgi:hypothetical protein
MANPNRRSITNRLFDFGGNIQNMEDWPLLGGLYLRGENLIHGADSAAFVRARWYKADELVDEDGHPTSMPLAEADPAASRMTEIIQRRKKEAVVVAAGQTAIIGILADNLGYKIAQQAVAFTYKGITRAGILPSDVDHGYEDDLCTAALRVGAEEFRAAPAIWLPHERTVVVPADADVLEQHVPINELHNKYPGTPLV